MDVAGALAHGVAVVPGLHPQQLSMSTPNAFSMRSAISGDRAAWPFTRSDRVARRTPRISAARATVRPSFSRISSRMSSPGGDGFMPIF
jgi:hypothetical protein